MTFRFYFDTHAKRWVLAVNSTSYVMERWALEVVTRDLGFEPNYKQIEQLLYLWRETRIDQGYREGFNGCYGFLPVVFNSMLHKVVPDAEMAL